MSTEFYNVDGELVALRYWGGDERGTVVELQPAAAKVREMDEPLFGDDGSQENLRTLAEWVGRNRLTPAEIVERERERAEAFRAETGLQGRAARLLVKPRERERTWGGETDAQQRARLTADHGDSRDDCPHGLSAEMHAAHQLDCDHGVKPGFWGNCEHCGEACGPNNPHSAHGLGRCKSL